MTDKMKLADPVRSYTNDWFIEGKIYRIDGDIVEVDFLDWITQYRRSDLIKRHIHYNTFWVVTRVGTIIKDFRDLV